ncbi:dihydrofolate reductase family protein [Chitinophaga sp. GCM10012297]|uniref:Dihydrofolate reductase family protein n=1 Tax=Chitinophaga chungangae TaxID=2821488 RepID=A0ABS3YAA1_9BACT|nr:dihydrofolate reductase family protein [Chitinophaga chungangae]MBO9151612.1 dihydrofolate reductase family protein [Chitinophaga chungangae]
MRKIILTVFVSLDGVMQAPGGPQEDTTGGFEWGGWQANYGDDLLGKVMTEIMAQPFDLLLGRRTYEIFSAYWPYNTDNPIGDKFTRAKKYVVCNHPLDLPWENSTQVQGNIVAELKKLKQQDGDPLMVWGSGVLVQTLLEANLIDSINLLTYPITIGKGKRLFGNGTQPVTFKLTSSKISPSGVVVATYEPAGKLVPGSFVTGAPSEAELARREKWKAEK